MEIILKLFGELVFTMSKNLINTYILIIMIIIIIKRYFYSTCLSKVTKCFTTGIQHYRTTHDKTKI